MTHELHGLHGIIVDSLPEDPFGYYAWPTVARTEEGTLWVAASGLRNAHLCPWGKSVVFRSNDNGCSWSSPLIVNNSMIDDRDCGLLALPGNRLLLSWFTSDTRQWGFVARHVQHGLDYRPVLGGWDDATVQLELGSFVRVMEADNSWSSRRRVPVSTPHGPILSGDGSLLYLGRCVEGACKGKRQDSSSDGLELYRSEDDGETWQLISRLRQPEGEGYYCEPHLLEFPDGRLLAMIREEGGGRHFSMVQMESSDHGVTWTAPHCIASGSPPHLLRHSSGTLICTYGWRRFPGFGQRVIFSHDDGQSWSEPWVLRDDAPNDDLGYPSTVELADGSLFSVYYQHSVADNLNSSLMWSRWSLPV